MPHPIETAPRDGTVVRLFNDKWPASMTGYWRDGAWHAEKKVWTLGPGREIEDPTHWMPER